MIAIKRILISHLLFLICRLLDLRQTTTVLLVDRASFLAKIGRVLVLNNLTTLILQKGEQLRQARKAPPLTSVGILNGSPPIGLPFVPHLPQAQQVSQVPSLSLFHEFLHAPFSSRWLKLIKLSIALSRVETV
jgi:hypothetical protein